VTDTDTSAAPEAQPRDQAPSKGLYSRERAVVGAVFFAITGAIIVNGAIQIHRDTFRPATVASSYATCSAGIAALYDQFATQLSTVNFQGTSATPQSPSHDPSVRGSLAELDEQLLALRPVCAREGEHARSAYDSLMLWRHRAQDQSRVQERTLNQDAERALHYQSPPQSP
jgi:hypothetical protein